MKHVDFLETQSDGSQEVLATVWLVDNKLRTKGNRAFITSMGIRRGYPIAGGKMLKPKDGDAFLNGLSRAFSGSMIRATEPYDD